MISIYNIKPQFQKLLTPVLHFLHTQQVTANQITLSACALSFIIGGLFWFADSNRLFFLALPIGLLIRMALNALDGMMARQYNQVSKKGEMLNELGDVISDLVIFFPLLKFQPEALGFVVLFIVLSVVNEYAGIMGKVISGERRYEGPMGKSDRAFLISLYGLLQFFSVDISPYSSYLFGAAVLLVVLSTTVRVKKALAN
ncbi:MAG: CDP-alcohol phosphatidyltransferase family protein [Tannerellaceae bacterium]|nr:CDP-alcohol phosphatidyltransferase family protein [Tannerellaceae bacterium]